MTVTEFPALPATPQGTRLAEELTVADVDALLGFFKARVLEVINQHGADSNEGHTARALMETVQANDDSMRITFYEDPEVTVDDLRRRARAWDRAVILASSWSEHADYDAENWCLLG
jgi:hypothetical protein